MLKKIVMLSAMGFGVGVLPLAAQEPATLLLKNGQRMPVEVLDLNASGLTVRVNGQERAFNPNEVAMLEFAGGPAPADAQARISAGTPLAILRNGQTIEGRLVDIGGSRPLRLTFDVAGQTRDMTSNDVAQIYFSNPGGQPVATSGQAAGQAAQPGAGGTSITVQANQQWTDTGIVVARGERVQFNASGDIMVAEGASSGVGGSPINPGGRLPVANAGVGALIGRVGNGAPFLIGSNTTAIPMTANGRLMLGVNDEHHNDNSGSFTVSITRLGR